MLLAQAETAAGHRRRRTRRGGDARRPVTAEDVISYLRDREITLTYDPRTGALQADNPEAVTAIIGRAS